MTSVNGPEYSRGDDSLLVAAWMKFNDYHVGLEGLGGPGSWGFIGPEWANAAASPGALYKFYATEGGVRVPLIISGPGVEQSHIHAPAMVADIAPTLMEWVNAAPAPDSAKPITGRSLLPVISGEMQSVYGPDDVRAIEVSGNSALYKGDYKITRSMPPIGDGRWRLFNLREDPGETADLSQTHADVLEDLISEFDDYSRTVGVLPMPDGYDTYKTLIHNSTQRALGHYPYVAFALAMLFLAALFGVWLGARALFRRSRA